MANFLAEKGPVPDYTLSGGIFGKSYAIDFKGGAAIAGPLVRVTLDSLKQPDGTWRKLHCPSPIQGEPEIQLFLNPDRDPIKLQSDFHFRCLKRSVQKLRPDPTYLNDPRDLLISLRFRSLVQLVWDWNKGAYKIVWFEAGRVFFPQEARSDVEKSYADATTNPGGG